MLVHTKDPERFGRCVDVLEEASLRSSTKWRQRLSLSAVTGEERKADADVGGEWRRANGSRRLE
jgi:hypothetical protein